MLAVMGIELGRSVIRAVMLQDGKFESLGPDESHGTFPASISFAGGEIILCQPDCQEDKCKCFPLGEYLEQTGGIEPNKLYEQALIQAYSLCFENLGRYVQSSLGEKLDSLVASVPVSYDFKQRKILVDAAGKCGVSLRLLDNCAADALAWMVRNPDISGNFIFLNCTHNDISLCICELGDGVAGVMSSAGLARDGQEDIDNFPKILEKLFAACLQESGLENNSMAGLVLNGSQDLFGMAQNVAAKFIPNLNISFCKDYMTALGAAARNAILSGDLRDCLILEATSKDIEIEIPLGKFVVMPHNSTFPIRKSHKLPAYEKDQQSFSYNILSTNPANGMSSNVAKVEHVLKQPAEPGEEIIDIHVEVTGSGTFMLFSKDLRSGDEQSIVF